MKLIVADGTGDSAVIRRRSLCLILVCACCLGRMAGAREARSVYVPRIEKGTLITVRSVESINVRGRDGEVFAGRVELDVLDATGRLAVTAGSSVELVVRMSDGDLTLDVDSVVVDDRRYAVPPAVNRVDLEHHPDAARTGEFIEGGSLLATIVGLPDRGETREPGAAAADAAGVFSPRGRAVRIPRGSLVTFRLDRSLDVGVADLGYTCDGRHFHVVLRLQA